MQLFVIFFSSQNQLIIGDEIESVHAAWKIATGQVIYVDFFEHHHPFIYYLLVPLIWAFKENLVMVFAARGLVFLFLMFIFIVVYKISKDLFCKESAIISLILLSTTKVFLTKAVEIRPDVPQLLFALLSIFLLFRYFQKKKLERLILSAISLGISFLFLQKSIYLGFIIGVILLCDCSDQKRFKRVLIYLLVFIATLIPYYSYLIFNAQFHAYFIYNWVLNFDLMHKFTYRVDWARVTLIWALKQNAVPWFFWVLSFFFLKTSNQKRMVGISLFLMTLYFSVGLPYTQYLMLFITLMAILAGHAIYEMSDLFLGNKLIVTGLILIASLSFSLQECPSDMFHGSSIAKLNKLKYVLSITKPQDFIYDHAVDINLFSRDLEYYWFWPQMLTADSWKKYNKLYNYNFDELIDRCKPKIISEWSVLDVRDKLLMKYYKRSELYPDLFIRSD